MSTRQKREQPKAAKTGIAKQPHVWVVETRDREHESERWSKWYPWMSGVTEVSVSYYIGTNTEFDQFRIRKYVRSES